MDTATAEQVRDTLAAPIRLTLHDRCDRCGFQAYVRVVKETATIDMCAHHYGVNALALMSGGWDVVDDTRESLVEAKPGK